MPSVAVIGAGACGLTAIKCSLDEGFSVTCFERTNDIGGLWNYTEEVRYGQACVMKSTVINTSKEMMSYSDFPCPREFPMFMHNTHVKKYFQAYIDNFGLMKHIKLEHEIVHVKHSADFDKTGKWDLRIKNSKTGEVKDAIFDYVMVCTGHHAYPNIPQFPGQEEFQGKIIHSHDYKTSKGYEDTRSVVVGIGNSGADTVVELSRVCAQAFLVTRRGSWLFSRMGPGGSPIDMNVGRRSVSMLIDLLPKKFMLRKTEEFLNNRIDHEKFALKPKHSPFSQHPTNNDDLPTRIICGSVKVKPNIKRFTKTGIEFEDGTFEDNIDHVIMATGYVFGFPFVERSVLEIRDNQNGMYKYMFPIDEGKHTLAVIGCFQPVGAIMPVAEMQCRLATRVFKGLITLPSRDQMKEDVQTKHEAMSQRYVQTKRHTMQVDYIKFMDELADIIGCKPNFVKLALTDPCLAHKCFFDPCTPYQYRLHGPGAWYGARDAIFSQWERTFYPMQTRPVEMAPKSKSYALYYMLVLLIIFVAYCLRFLVL